MAEGCSGEATVEAQAAETLELLIDYLSDGHFDMCVSLQPKAVELAEAVAASAPGLAGKLYGNLSSAYVQLQQLDPTVKHMKRHLEIWQEANYLPEQQESLIKQLSIIVDYVQQDIQQRMQEACMEQDWISGAALKDRIAATLDDPLVDREWAAQMANNLGLVFVRLDNTEEATTFMMKALEIAESLGDKVLIDSTKRNLDHCTMAPDQ